MVSFLRVAVRKLNSLPKSRKYDNRVYTDKKVPTVDSSSLADRFRTTCPPKPSWVSMGMGNHGLNVTYSSSRTWMGCRHTKSWWSSGLGVPTEGHEVKGATCSNVSRTVYHYPNPRTRGPCSTLPKHPSAAQEYMQPVPKPLRAHPSDGLCDRSLRHGRHFLMAVAVLSRDPCLIRDIDAEEGNLPQAASFLW